MSGIKRIYSNAIYMRSGKHKCLKCGEELSITKDSVIVNSKSELAEKYDFYAVDAYLSGDVEFIIDMFVCDKCTFKMHVNNYEKIDNAITKMEDKNDCGENAGRIKYVYDDNLECAFENKKSCPLCDGELEPNYEILHNKDELGEIITFDSFDNYMVSNDKIEIRKIFFICSECNNRIEISDVCKEKIMLKRILY